MTALTAGTIVGAGVAVHLVAERSLRGNLDDSIIELARTEVASATDRDTVHVHEMNPTTLVVKGAPGYEKFVWILDAKDRVVAQTSNVSGAGEVTRDESLLAAAREGKARFGDIRVGQTPIRAVYYPFTDQAGAHYTGVVGVPSQVVETTTASLGQVVLLAGFCGVAVTFGIAFVLAKSLTDPLSQLARSAERIDPERPESAARMEAPYEEINGVAAATNRLVDRVRQVLRERDRTIDVQRQFLADASHELRTPISNMRGTLEVALRRERTADELRSALEITHGETERMGRLVEDLLALAKSDLGQLQIRRDSVDLAELLREAVRALPPRADVAVQVSVPERAHAVGDEGRLRQAIDNLLSNAMRHASSRVDVALVDATSDWNVRVANDGPPIAAADEEHLFERFFRADAGRGRASGGSGLGLAIVRSLAEAHGGRVTVVSNQDETCFCLHLPKG